MANKTKKPKDLKSVFLGFKSEPGLAEQIRKAAAAEDRTMGSYIRLVMVAHLKKKRGK